MYYLDIVFYHYFIGREDQSVNENVMIKRIDQVIKVNKIMFEQVNFNNLQNSKMRRYMINYLMIITTVTSTLLIRSNEEENLIKKKKLWNYVKKKDLWLYIKMRFSMLGIISNLPFKIGRMLTINFYLIAKRIYGFN